jgi:hypothetical protein
METGAQEQRRELTGRVEKGTQKGRSREEGLRSSGAEQQMRQGRCNCHCHCPALPASPVLVLCVYVCVCLDVLDMAVSRVGVTLLQSPENVSPEITYFIHAWVKVTVSIPAP